MDGFKIVSIHIVPEMHNNSAALKILTSILFKNDLCYPNITLQIIKPNMSAG